MPTKLLTPFQQEKYRSIKNKTLAKRYKTHCLATNKIKQQEEEKQEEEARKREHKVYRLVEKPCSLLKIGDIFKANIDPYFCEVLEILPNPILPPYLLLRLKLLPDGIVGEGPYLHPYRVVLVKEFYDFNIYQ